MQTLPESIESYVQGDPKPLLDILMPVIENAVQYLCSKQWALRPYAEDLAQDIICSLLEDPQNIPRDSGDLRSQVVRLAGRLSYQNYRHWKPVKLKKASLIDEGRTDDTEACCGDFGGLSRIAWRPPYRSEDCERVVEQLFLCRTVEDAAKAVKELFGGKPPKGLFGYVLVELRLCAMGRGTSKGADCIDGFRLTRRRRRRTSIYRI